jgi:Flp pilus assembly protein TadD
MLGYGSFDVPKVPTLVSMTPRSPVFVDAQVHHRAGRLAEAERLYRQILLDEGPSPEVFYYLGAIAAATGRLEDSEAALRQAVAFNPRYAEAHEYLAAVRGQQGRLDEAIASMQQAIALKPHSVEAHFNLGLACLKRARFDEAIACWSRVVELSPEHVEAHWHRAVTWLLIGNFARGWSEYEWRWRTKEARPQAALQPLWDGSAPAGKTMLLYCEQGMGDTIQFVRYARLVQQRGARVIVGCQERLLKLFAGCPYIDQVVNEVAVTLKFDWCAPLMSLPRIFSTTLESIPCDVPYIFAPAPLCRQWRERLAGLNGFKVGIAWQGKPTYQSDRTRSLPLAHFAPLAQVPGVRLLSLQKNVGTEQVAQLGGRFPLVDFAAELDEAAGPFMDTAAVMMNLDLVVTSDTSIAHLAGALGVPVWVALPFVPDWRWLLARSDSPWYPTMRLFRQPQPGDWTGVFAAIAQALAERVHKQ